MPAGIDFSSFLSLQHRPRLKYREGSLSPTLLGGCPTIKKTTRFLSLTQEEPNREMNLAEATHLLAQREDLKTLVNAELFQISVRISVFLSNFFVYICYFSSRNGKNRDSTELYMLLSSKSRVSMRMHNTPSIIPLPRMTSSNQSTLSIW
jgi:hypothetical protein